MAQIPSSLVRFSSKVHFVDIAIGALAPVAAVLVREFDYMSRADLAPLAVYTGIATVATVVSVLYFRVAHILSRFFSVEDIRAILKAAAVATLFTAVVSFSIMRLDAIPRSLPVLHFLVLAIGLLGARWLRSEQYRSIDKNPGADGGAVENVLLIGATRMAWFYIRMLDCIPGRTQKIVALLDDNAQMQGRSLCGLPIVGGIDRAESVVTEYQTHGVAIDRMIITFPDLQTRAEAEVRLAKMCETRGILLDIMADRFDIGISESFARETSMFDPDITPLATARNYLRVRRVVDIFVAGAVATLCAPLFVLVALAVMVDVGAPSVFWQERVGRSGRPIYVHKFRTLRAPVDRAGRAIPEDQRLSNIGRFLRASRLDELPQLFDILRGEMSLIGPRPLLPVDLPEDATIRLQVPPGLTGWAQVHGGKLVTAEEKNALDEWYITHVSPALDLRIIWLTLLTSIRGDRRKEKAVTRAMRFRSRRLLSTASSYEKENLRDSKDMNHRAA